MKVLDYSVGRPSPASIVAGGYVGVMRYVCPNGLPKQISAAEYAALRAAGLVVCLNWEWYDVRPREGAAAGTYDATEALKQANALGYNGAIYFSVDFQATTADMPAIDAYMKACAAVVGLPRLGAYGDYAVLKHLFDSSLITFGWQTTAWSNKQVESRAHLIQNTYKLFAGDADSSDVLKANWQGGSMVPAGWHDDGTTLTAPNGHKVVRGFRDYVLAYPGGWPASNQPLNEEYPWQSSTRQDFTYSSRGWNPTQGQFSIPIGQELADAKAALAAVPPPTPPAPPAGPSKADLAIAAIKAALV